MDAFVRKRKHSFGFVAYVEVVQSNTQGTTINTFAVPWSKFCENILADTLKNGICHGDVKCEVLRQRRPVNLHRQKNLTGI